MISRVLDDPIDQPLRVEMHLDTPRSKSRFLSVLDICLRWREPFVLLGEKLDEKLDSALVGRLERHDCPVLATKVEACRGQENHVRSNHGRTMRFLKFPCEHDAIDGNHATLAMKQQVKALLRRVRTNVFHLRVSAATEFELVTTTAQKAETRDLHSGKTCSRTRADGCTRAKEYPLQPAMNTAQRTR